LRLDVDHARRRPSGGPPSGRARHRRAPPPRSVPCRAVRIVWILSGGTVAPRRARVKPSRDYRSASGKSEGWLGTGGGRGRARRGPPSGRRAAARRGRSPSSRAGRPSAPPADLACDHVVLFAALPRSADLDEDLASDQALQLLEPLPPLRLEVPHEVGVRPHE